jgi:hypothetical protein
MAVATSCDFVATKDVLGVELANRSPESRLFSSLVSGGIFVRSGDEAYQTGKESLLWRSLLIF